MSQIMLPFLSALKEHNNRDWMAENKPRHREAAAQFEGLVDELLLRLTAIEPGLAGIQAKSLVGRLNRDTRFSHDKSPYRPAFHAHLSTGGRNPVPVGFFLQIAPQGSFLGGGLFAAMFPDATARMRDYLLEHGAEFEEILHNPDFSTHFSLRGEALKNVPRGYPKDSPYADYLRYKSWYLEYPLPDEAFADLSAFCDKAVALFTLMKPFNDFLNRALDGFQMPERPGKAK